MRTSCILSAVVAAVFMWAPSAHAQTPSSPLPVKLGQHVWVTVTDGADVEGVIGAIAAESIAVQGEHGTTWVNTSNVRRIATRKSLKTGALVGGSALMGYALVTGLTRLPDMKGPVIVTSVIIGFPIGAGIGALTARAIGGRRTVYERPSSPGLQLMPVVAYRSVGIAGAVRW